MEFFLFFSSVCFSGSRGVYVCDAARDFNGSHPRRPETRCHTRLRRILSWNTHTHSTTGSDPHTDSVLLLEVQDNTIKQQLKCRTFLRCQCFIYQEINPDFTTIFYQGGASVRSDLMRTLLWFGVHH